MDSYIFLTLGIISSWLIWFSYMLYITLTQDKSFVFIIFNKKQLVRYWLFIITIVCMSFYLFFIRTRNMGRVINIYSIWEYFLGIIDLVPLNILIILAMVIILWIIVIFLAMRLLYNYMYSTLLALYLYYYQYNFFRRKLVSPQINLRVNFNMYLTRRILFFTKKNFYLIIAGIIWPRSFYWLEPRICKIIIPYLIIFDVITQDGNISKIFQVIPWYYLYMLLRTAWITFDDFFKQENTRFSNAVYKKIILNGKIHRVIVLPDPKDFNLK